MSASAAWVKVDAHLDSNPKILAAGFWGSVVYQALLRINRRNGFDGSIPPHYTEPDYLASQLQLTGAVNFVNEPVSAIAFGITSALSARLIARAEDRTIVIVGWGDDWRGYRNREEKRKEEKRRSRSSELTGRLLAALPVAERVLARLSEQSGYGYRPCKTHVARIARLIDEGYTEEQIRKVVWHKCEQWKADPRMRIFLRPSTLFGPDNFAEYLPQAEAAYSERTEARSRS